MPDHATTDNGRQVHVLCQAAAVFFIRQEIDRQRQPTPGEHRYHTLLTQGADQAVERIGEM